jgi:hypothetical protein
LVSLAWLGWPHRPGCAYTTTECTEQAETTETADQTEGF